MHWIHRSRVTLTATVTDFPDTRSYLYGTVTYLTAKTDEGTVRIKMTAVVAAIAVPGDIVEIDSGHVELDAYGRAVLVADRGRVYNEKTTCYILTTEPDQV